MPALALATGGPLLWLYNINIVGAYAIAWGALLAFALRLGDTSDGARSSPSVLRVAYLGPPVLTAIWLAVAGLLAPNLLSWFDLVYTGTTVLVVATLVSLVVLGVLAYVRSSDPLTRSRLRWTAGGAVLRRARVWRSGSCRS